MAYGCYLMIGRANICNAAVDGKKEELISLLSLYSPLVKSMAKNELERTGKEDALKFLDDCSKEMEKVPEGAAGDGGPNP